VAQRKQPRWTQVARIGTRAVFGIYILVASLRHHLGGTHTASLHALCPFGAVETVGSLITSGAYIQKIHPSSLVLGVGLLLSALIAGGAFCGWICPYGAVQDLLTWIRGKLRWREVVVPPRVDRVLRYGRFVALIAILYATMATAKLWFADYDPYYGLFSLGWIFEFDLATFWPGYLITLAILAGSVFIPRLWCRYLCPLGGLLSLIQRISPLKVRRDAHLCIDCKRCDRACPMKLNVSTAPAVTHDCTLCESCVEACPVAGALETAWPHYGQHASGEKELAR